ncbi:hypothetical protein [Stygiolobus caldivivus]|uniref:Carbohydrate kinase PfkB domain-containing protein n=1 Tax=Stygiolobus caldivivus TaxID=2824673 RepID=A0A8D5U6G9_9CREN|nr:hypothetical protein [Stygiolobus caldivivus]BCU70525.1 hypothetical protein KN1_18220 [Stygiolobus caldivivus]
MKAKSKVMIIGNFTLDLGISEKEQLGGPPLYSGFAIYMLGGVPLIYSSIEKSHYHLIPHFLQKTKLFYSNSIPTFELIYTNKGRVLILRKKPEKGIPINNIDYKDLDGVLVNPVCGEVNEIPSVNKPLALDLQGFVRSCRENEQVEIKPTQFNIRVSSSYNLRILHANYEEIDSSKISIGKVLEMGFREVLVSYDEDGFIVYSKSEINKYRPSRIGDYKVGTGDVLISSYFLYRLNNFSISEATQMSGEFVEWFSNEGHHLLFHKY